MADKTRSQTPDTLDDTDLDQAQGAGTHYAFVKFEANGTTVTNTEEIVMVAERIEKG